MCLSLGRLSFVASVSGRFASVGAWALKIDILVVAFVDSHAELGDPWGTQCWMPDSKVDHQIL